MDRGPDLPIPRPTDAAKTAGAWERVPLDKHSGDFLRLQRLLQWRDHFQLIIARFNVPAYRDALIAALDPGLDSPGPTPTVWSLPETPDLAQFRADLPGRVAGASALHLVGLDTWLAQDPGPTLRGLNYGREAIAAGARMPLVVWLAAGQVRTFAEQAPDLWAWRTAVLDFTLQPRELLPIERESLVGPLRVDEERARRRLAEIDSYLAESQATAATADLLLEAADLRRGLGDWDLALARAGEALGQFRTLDNARGAALALGEIADILVGRGQLAEALRIRLEEEIPVFDRLGDLHSKAVAQGKIADILSARGQFDEALRIRLEEEIPVYERLGDLRSKAVTQAKIAGILVARGQFPEALRILTEEVLPIFERFGDLRSKAVTQGKIADILMARGQVDEALRIRLEEEFPVYERIGDLRSKAATLGKIADILTALGQLGEALRILTDEVLPVFERLGDLREEAVAQANIADILVARGQFAEALRILTEEVLPAFERLGDLRGLLICRTKIALTLLARDPAARPPWDRAEAQALLCLALAEARQLRIPEAEQIEEILQQQGLGCDSPG